MNLRSSVVRFPAKYVDDGLTTRLSPRELVAVFADFGYPMSLNCLVVNDEVPLSRLGCEVSLRPGRLVGLPDQYCDYSFCAALPKGEAITLEWIVLWNRSRRFTRLYEIGGSLVLEMDVSLAGGVCRGYLLQAIERWDDAVEDLLVSLLKEAVTPLAGEALASQAH